MSLVTSFLSIFGKVTKTDEKDCSLGLTLPEKIALHLGTKPGDIVLFETQPGNRVVITKVEPNKTIGSH
jgi:hypothetical protein